MGILNFKVNADSEICTFNINIRILKTWNYYIDRANVLEYDEITPELRMEWKNALTFLSKELGKAFLIGCDKQHPIFIAVQNSATGAVWAIKNVITVASTLSHLKSNSDSYKKLKEKLYSSAKCRQEGMPFLEVAAMCIDSNYCVTILDEVPGQKNPDIEVIDPLSKDRLFIEVSKLNINDEAKASEASYKYFQCSFPLLDIPFSCYQVRNFESTEIASVFDTVSAIRVETALNNRLTYHEDEQIRIAMAPDHMRLQFEEWCLLNDMRPGVHGMPLNFDETKRIQNNKLDKECRQINEGTTGVIIIPCNPIYFYLVDIDAAVASFRKKIAAYPCVLGIAVYADIADASEEFVVSGKDYSYSCKLTGNVVARKMLFVKNPAYGNQLGKEARLKIQEVFSYA